MANETKAQLLDLAAELAEKLPAHECCELLNRYMLSDFFYDSQDGTFSYVIEHMIEDHGSQQSCGMAVAIYQLNAESAMREAELFAQYKIESPPRYDPAIRGSNAMPELLERLKAMMASENEHKVH